MATICAGGESEVTTDATTSRPRTADGPTMIAFRRSACAARGKIRHRVGAAGPCSTSGACTIPTYRSKGAGGPRARRRTKRARGGHSAHLVSDIGRACPRSGARSAGAAIDDSCRELSDPYMAGGRASSRTEPAVIDAGPRSAISGCHLGAARVAMRADASTVLSGEGGRRDGGVFKSRKGSSRSSRRRDPQHHDHRARRDRRRAWLALDRLSTR